MPKSVTRKGRRLNLWNSAAAAAGFDGGAAAEPCSLAPATAPGHEVHDNAGGLRCLAMTILVGPLLIGKRCSGALVEVRGHPG